MPSSKPACRAGLISAAELCWSGEPLEATMVALPSYVCADTLHQSLPMLNRLRSQRAFPQTLEMAGRNSDLPVLISRPVVSEEKGLLRIAFIGFKSHDLRLAPDN